MSFDFTLIGVVRLLLEMWVFYVVGITVLNKWGTLPMGSKVVGGPFAAYAAALDVFLQFTVVSVLFFDPPRELTITKRLHRYQKSDPQSLRGRLAKWVCTQLLNPFDPDHC